MEWLVAIPLALMFTLFALMMLSIMVRGWVGGGRHRGHGMMMCMGHRAGDGPRTFRMGLLEELKAERERLDHIITTAEREAAARPE